MKTDFKKLSREFVRFLRRNLSVILIATGMVLLVVLFLFFTPMGYRFLYQASVSANTQTVKSNTDFECMEKSLPASMVFAVEGEVQTAAQGKAIGDLACYLYQNDSLSYIGTDLGYSCAGLLDYYLEWGKEECLQQAFEDPESEQAQLWISFCRELYALKSEKKKTVRIFGWENDTSAAVVVRYLTLLIDDVGINQSTNEQIASMLSSPSQDGVYLYYLSDSYHAYENLYHEFFGSDFLYFSQAMKYAQPVLKNADAVEQAATQDRVETLTALSDRFVRGKYLLISQDTSLLEQSQDCNYSLNERKISIRLAQGDAYAVRDQISLASNAAWYEKLNRLFGRETDSEIKQISQWEYTILCP